MLFNNFYSGIYIHIPFCYSKCNYCSFYSESNYNLVKDFLIGILKEIELNSNNFKKNIFDSIYFGGGTPTSISVKNIEKIINVLNLQFKFSLTKEMTIEANPQNLNYLNLFSLTSLGFNRISIGIQSFNEKFLKKLGRTYSTFEAIKSIENARLAGFKNIGLDLIYGISGQSIKSFINDLNIALSFKPEHLSCYQLTNTKEINKNEMQGRQFFIRISDFLRKKGYFHYEISNYSYGKNFISKHNQKYWNHKSYLGFGPSSHSFFTNKRWWNYSDIKKYLNAIKNNILPIQETEILNKRDICLEILCLGLRTKKGISLKKLEFFMNKKISLKELFFLKSLCRKGYAIINNDNFFLTIKGMVIIDHIASKLATLFEI